MSCQSFIKKKGCDNDEKEKNNWNYRLGAYISYCAFLCVRIRPMVKEYKKIAYDKLANIDEDTFAKLENTKVYGKNGELIGEVNSGSYQYKKISEISKYVQDGYIAVEDKTLNPIMESIIWQL